MITRNHANRERKRQSCAKLYCRGKESQETIESYTHLSSVENKVSKDTRSE